MNYLIVRENISAEFVVYTILVEYLASDIPKQHWGLYTSNAATSDSAIHK